MGGVRKVFITYNGVEKSLMEWCESLGLNYLKTYQRIFRFNWSVYKAFNWSIKVSDKLENRFWDNIYFGLDGCWYWTGAINGQGYGNIRDNYNRTLAHRLSYQMHKGDIGNLCVLHRCDNRKCVNPDHLFLGDRADNVLDMCAKGRNKVFLGESNSSAKLTREDVYAIRQSEESAPILAKKYNVSATHIHGCKKRTVWKHI